MPTFKDKKKICAICGCENTVQKICSMSAFGYSDLDFRPPMPKRALDVLMVEECENCGYVNNNIDSAPYNKENIKSIISSDEYILLSQYSDIPPVAKLYIRYAMIGKAENICDDQISERYLKAAWACDDAGKIESAKQLRILSAKHMELMYDFQNIKLSRVKTTHFQCFDINRIIVQYADVLRRSEQFDKLLQLSKLELKEPCLNKAFKFEIEKAKCHDTSRYSFNDEMTSVPKKLKFPRPMNTEYSFENFKVSSLNRFAHAACQAVSVMPGDAYNPLLIYGPTCSGKTHLLRAIQNNISKLYPEKKVLRISMMDFLEQLLEGINDEENGLQNRNLTYDVLLIDDLFYLRGRPITQEAMAHLIELYVEQNKQVVLALEGQPKDIIVLSDAIRNNPKMQNGLFCDIARNDIKNGDK